MVVRICKTCGIEYKTFPAHKLFYCSAKCYVRTGDKNPKWKGGVLLFDGYRYLSAPYHPNAIKTGYVAEHRLVMEKHLGRLLLRSEVVHHVNGDKLNNDISNLVLCKSTGKHFIEEHLLCRDTKGRFFLTK